MTSLALDPISGPITGPILALDTSGSACGVVLWHQGRLLARRDQVMTHGHAEALAPLTQEALAEASLSMRDMAAIAVTVGPGSFTGLRVGLAFARGLGVATGCPVLGLPGPVVLAAMVRANHAPAAESFPDPIAVILDARRSEVFVQVFAADQRPLAPVVSVPPEQVADLLPAEGPVCLTGDGVALLPEDLSASPRLTIAASAGAPPDPAMLATLVAAAPEHACPPRPLYGRAPDATPPAANPRAANPRAADPHTSASPQP